MTVATDPQPETTATRPGDGASPPSAEARDQPGDSVAEASVHSRVPVPRE